MKKYLFLLFIIPIISYSQTDYVCLNDCTAKNYQYGFCKSKCSFNEKPIQNLYNTPIVQPIKHTDYQCVSDCTSKGYQYQFCTSRCSF